MTIGIEQFRTRRDLWLDWMLIQPLRGYASDTRSIVASETIRCVRLMRRLLAGLLLAAVVPPDTATSETPTRHNQLWIPMNVHPLL